jgi:hypothetical protein
MKPHGIPGRLPGVRLFLLMAFSALLIMPCSVSGATPPLPPLLTVSVSNDTLSPGENLSVSATWSRDESFYRPPQSVDVQIYSVPGGSFVAGYTVPEDERAVFDGDTRHFRGVIASSELPAGRLLLVVVDPVSGADARVPINVTEPGPDFPKIQVQGYLDAVFFLVVGVLLVVLGAGLVLLLRRP